jgi:hypothetical protein
MRPGKGTSSRSRGRLWRRQPMLWRGNLGGWRWPAAQERDEGDGERWCGRGETREKAKTRERKEEAPFYRGGERADHGRGGERRRKSRSAAMESGRGWRVRSRRLGAPFNGEIGGS